MEACEERLMMAYQQGDADALDGIYRLMQKPLYSFIYRYTRDEQFSIDVVQDTFMKLQDHRDRFDAEKGSLKNFLFQIAYRLMITKLNRRKKLQSLLPYLMPRAKEAVSSADRLTIREAVAKLPDIERAVILLFYYHDMSQEEMAKVLSIPKGTVKSRLHRATKLLKNELEGYYDASESAR